MPARLPPSGPYAALAQRLRDARRARYLRAADVALMIGVDAAVYSLYERGATRPARDRTVRLAAVLGIPEHELLVLARWEPPGRP